MPNPDELTEKKEILNRYRNLLRVCKPKTSQKDKLLIRKAFDLAVEAHKDMRRKSGEPYIYHPIDTATIAAEEIGLGTTSVVCALLHDVVEDTDYTLEDIRGLFGDKVAKIIDGLTKISGIFDNKSESQQAENFRKMLLTLSDDVRVILIKLADRLNNMRTLGSLPREKQLKIASETSFLYAPLAHRLGLFTIKTELEDLAFKHMEPEIYNTIDYMIRESEPERKKFITKFVAPIKKDLTEKNINAEILTRTKSIFSIWEKMRKKEIPFEEVYDLFAIRIILDVPPEKEKSECFNVYALVTDNYRPNKDRFRDWISIPKANGYEALHTTVMSHTGKWVEVQIRSKRMDEIAEKGFAAHWKYKAGTHGDTGLEDWMAKIRELLQSPESDALDFLDNFKLNLFSDEIYIFTPKGDLITMPSKSTTLDFAYGIHSDIGNRCIGAKVNHKLVPLDYTLKSGDQVEIITSDKQTPKENWYDYVTTAKAKSQIKAFVKETKKKQASDGKLKLKKEFEELKIEFNNNNINKLMSFLEYVNPATLFVDAAKDIVGMKEVKACFFEKETWLRYIPSIPNPFAKSKHSESKKEKDAVEKKSQRDKVAEQPLLSSQVDNIKYKIAQCCKPILGDEVIGLIEKNGEISVHKANCNQAVEFMTKYGKKIVKSKWLSGDSLQFLAGISIKGFDRLGMIRDITDVISKQLNINIRSLTLETSGGIFEGILTVYIQNTSQLKNLMENIKTVNGVESVNRID
ncbi:MAG TPA: RelA/SpoT family protein [Bacteroidales bacterium]|nr:RelA/SpoT family protein [Bacteroidales bacterium]HPS26200.1 RelA/SpoT family protein [Bacteroidales bacterium]